MQIGRGRSSASTSCKEVPLSDHYDPAAVPAQNAYSIFLNRQKLPFIETFSDKLNKVLGGGLRATGTYVLTGGPGAGKTTFALHLADAAIDAGYPVIYVSAELLPQLVLARYASRKLGLGWLEVVDLEDPEKIAQYESFARSRGDLLWILDPEQSARYQDHIVAIRQYLDGLAGFRVPVLIIVDYIQDLAQTRIVHGKDPRAAVAELSREIRTFAQQQFCPILVVSSTSRSFYNGEDEKNDASLIASAKEAGEIEYNVNAVIYLRRHSIGQQVNIEAVIAKNRFGEHPLSVVFGTDPKTGEIYDSEIQGDFLKMSALIMRVYELIKVNPGKFTKAAGIGKTLGIKIHDAQHAIDALLQGVLTYQICEGWHGQPGYFPFEGAAVEALA